MTRGILASVLRLRDRSPLRPTYEIPHKVATGDLGTREVLAMLIFYVVVLGSFMMALRMGSIANWYPPTCVGARICTESGKNLALFGCPAGVVVLAPIANVVITKTRWSLSIIAIMCLLLPLVTLAWVSGLLEYLSGPPSSA